MTRREVLSPIAFHVSGLRLSLLFLFLLTLFGCGAGTVSESASSIANVGEKEKGSIEFLGLNSAMAISDTRIELTFFPARGGSSKYVYEINFSDSKETISVSSDILSPDYRGLLTYTLKGLNRLTNYQIRMSARDQESGSLGKNEVVKSVRTFTNEVARFDGILSASNIPGQDGKDSIKVRWMPAESSGSISKMDWDPKTYEIILVNSDLLTPGDMDQPGLDSTTGLYKYVVNHESSKNEYIVRGLPSNTKFYVRMRAIHEASVDDVFDLTKRGEMNNRYVSIRTLSDSLSDIKFQPDSFTVSLKSGSQGLVSVDTFWAEAKGVFDHYRLYFSKGGSTIDLNNLPDLCLSILLTQAPETTYCKKVDAKEVSSAISGLSPYMDHEFVLVLCQTSECSSNQRIISPIRSITTDPNLASFGGLTSTTTAKTFVDLGTAKLHFSIPNFNMGYFDGLILKLRRSMDPNDVSTEVTEFTAPEYFTTFNYLTQNFVLVNGIDYLSPDPYCFTLYPFKFAADGVTKTEIPNNVWRCFNAEIVTPTIREFSGLNFASTEGGYVLLKWAPPTTGVFTRYEIFWRKLSTSFSWTNALAQTDAFDFSNYGKAVVEDGDGELITVGPLADGVYVFGALTSIEYLTQSGLVRKRSELNDNFYTCTVSQNGALVLCSK